MVTARLNMPCTSIDQHMRSNGLSRRLQLGEGGDYLKKSIRLFWIIIEELAKVLS